MAFQFEVHLPVRDGRISCPVRRQQIDAAGCLSCRRLVSVTRRGDAEQVNCRPWTASNARWSVLR
jgi:hypothetical protein